MCHEKERENPEKTFSLNMLAIGKTNDSVVCLNFEKLNLKPFTTCYFSGAQFLNILKSMVL